MSFSNPLGFLALLAIPVLILIYIIKSKYTEQTIPSTYLWELSERFLKRKNPLKAITGILSLILQILAVVFVALAIAHPVFVVKDGANDYCFILDASGSMNVQTDGKTRFENGKESIRKIINSAADGSTYTLIQAGDSTDVVFHDLDDKRSALNQLNQLSSSYVYSGLNEALNLSQQYFERNNSMKFYLVTDKSFENTENINYIYAGGGTVNYGLSDVSCGNSLSGGQTVTKVTGKVWSYCGDAELKVNVFVDGSSHPAGSANVKVEANAGADFTVTLPVTAYGSLNVRIDGDDDMPLDNGVTLYGKADADSYKVLLVSKTPKFIEWAFAAADMSCDVISPDKYTQDACRGYSLYVFDSDDDKPFLPTALPSDGAVWFINPSGSVEKTGFTTRGKAEYGGEVNLNTSTSTKVRNLLKGTSEDDTTLAEYVKCGLNRTFFNLMYCNGDPVVFAGSNEYGNREVVFAFDWNLSDFPLSYNGRAVVKNLIDYTFPSLTDQTLAYSGETVSLNVLPGCTGLKVVSPSGEEDYLDVSETISEYELTEVGEYTVVATVGSGVKVASVFAQFPEEERILQVKETNFVLNGEAGTAKRDGKYEDILYLFIIIAVLLMADWAVYCYEQYQLR